MSDIGFQRIKAEVVRAERRQLKRISGSKTLKISYWKTFADVSLLYVNRI